MNEEQTHQENMQAREAQLKASIEKIKDSEDEHDKEMLRLYKSRLTEVQDELKRLSPPKPQPQKKKHD